MSPDAIDYLETLSLFAEVAADGTAVGPIDRRCNCERCSERDEREHGESGA